MFNLTIPLYCLLSSEVHCWTSGNRTSGNGDADASITSAASSLQCSALFIAQLRSGRHAQPPHVNMYSYRINIHGR
jgi:hypothetical protein